MNLLETITTGKAQMPPRLMIYGAEGVGKSSFAASAPKPIFVQTEDGFYILQRQPLDQDYLVANLVELMQRYQYASVESLVRDLQKELTVELNDFGKSLDLLAITMAEEN